MDISTIHIYSYNGVAIGDNNNYQTRILLDVAPTADSDIQEIQRSEASPIYTNKVLQSRILPLKIEVINGTFSALTNLFNPYDTEPHTLVAYDGSAYWSVDAVTKTISQQDFNSMMVSVYIADPTWKTSSSGGTASYNTDTWNITASGQTRSITVSGNQQARPVFSVSPTSARSGGYGFKRYVAVINSKVTQYIDALDLTDGGLDTAALTTAKLQADGDDLRIIYDVSGQEVFRWFGRSGIDTADTGVIVNVSLPPRISLTLDTAIAGSGAITQIKVQNTAANIAALSQLAAQSYKVLAIEFGTGDEEFFTYTGVNVNSLLITGVTRAQKESSMAAHSTGNEIVHVSAGYWFMYGNSAATAPSTDDTFKPLYDLPSFSNGTRSQTEFQDPANPNRLGQWRGAFQSNKGVSIYSATEYTFSGGVVTSMGMRVAPYYVGAVLRAGSGRTQWSLKHPAGITNVSSTGKTYRGGSSFPSIVAASFLTSPFDNGYTDIWTESSPGTAGVWGTITHNNISVPSAAQDSQFFFRMEGQVGTADVMAAFEINSVTYGLKSANLPQISFGAEINNNHADFRITNTTTGQWLEVHYPVPVGSHVIIDTELLNCYLLEDGSDIPILLDDESRSDWLLFDTGANILSYTETGAVAVTVVTTWRDVSL